MLMTKEHQDLMKSFERLYSHERLDREDVGLWKRSILYQDGNVNALFLAFRSGYMLGKAVQREETP